VRFVEYTGAGLRTADLLFTAPRRLAAVRLFPVVHIGRQRYYDALRRELDRCDYVLYELAGGQAQRAGHRVSYRWAARILGLTAQLDAFDYRHPPANWIHADFSAPEWQQARQRLPWYINLLLDQINLVTALVALLLALLRRRDLIARLLALVMEMESVLDQRTTVERVLVDERNAIILRRLAEVESRLAAERHQAVVGILYGAYHMPALARALMGMGYSCVQAGWISEFVL
jgi:hypothetical protein